MALDIDFIVKTCPENPTLSLKNIKQYDLLLYYIDAEKLNQQTIQNYYWLKDGHHNGKGYAMMARGVQLALQKNYPEIFDNLDTVKAK